MKTKKYLWTTVQHTWEDNESTVKPKCQLILMYLGHGRFGEYIPVKTSEQEILTLDNLSTNNTEKTPKKQPKRDCKRTQNQNVSNQHSIEKRETRKQRHVNYAHLNLGIDSNEDKSPPRKRKQSKAIALHEPSQTVLTAHNDQVTRKSLQRSAHDKRSLIGTVIMTPLAKEIKSENNKEIKTEQDWLNLPKNTPKEDFSLNDPNVRPRLVHRDGSLCHSKSAWASLNHKPPLKDFKLPAL